MVNYFSWKNSNYTCLVKCFLTLGFFILLGSSKPAFALCDKCPQPNVILYDFEVTTPRTGTESDPYNWMSHYQYSNFAKSALVNDDNTCVAYRDGDLFTYTGQPKDSLQQFSTTAHTPAAGKIGDGSTEKT